MANFLFVFFQAEQTVDFVTKLEDMEIKEMTTCEMAVEVTEESPSAVKWYKDGEPIEAGVTADSTVEFKSSGRKHSIVIKNATVHHEGEYVASVGDQECSCELTVVGESCHLTNFLGERHTYGPIGFSLLFYQINLKQIFLWKNRM